MLITLDDDYFTNKLTLLSFMIEVHTIVFIVFCNDPIKLMNDKHHFFDQTFILVWWYFNSWNREMI